MVKFKKFLKRLNQKIVPYEAKSGFELVLERRKDSRLKNLICSKIVKNYNTETRIKIFMIRKF